MQFEEKVRKIMVDVLSMYNQTKKYHFKITQEKTDLEQLAKQIDPCEYTRCLKSIYEQMSELLKSHH